MTAPYKAADVVTISRGDDVAVIHLYGATVVSWCSAGSEVLFVSSKSHFDNKKAIRGGIPVVFPNFGPWSKGPQHGFARISSWNHAGTQTSGNDDVTATFTLEDCEATRAMWDYRFQLQYDVQLCEGSLRCTLQVKNTGEDDFDFTCLLHTYLRVPSIEHCTVSGLKGSKYTDKVKDGENSVESQDLVRINDNVDRVYESVLCDHVVTNAVRDGACIVVTKHNLPDTVLWNPWKDKAVAMSDFGDEEYKSMVCVEAGAVASAYTLKAGSTFEGGQILRLMAKV